MIIVCSSFGISQYLLYYHNTDNSKITDESFSLKILGTSWFYLLIQSEALWILIKSLSSRRHLFCNSPSIWKNICHLWRRADHNCNWYIHLFVTLFICIYKSCLHTCESLSCSYRSLCCDFLVLIGSINIDTIVLHLLAQMDSNSSFMVQFIYSN